MRVSDWVYPWAGQSERSVGDSGPQQLEPLS